MSKFPPRLPLPHAIHQTRQQRNHQLIQAGILGIKFRFLVILIELIGVYFIHSSVLLVDALSSLVDVLCSFFIIICIKLAFRPPDTSHPFGHGRYEPISGLLTGAFLCLSGVFFFVQQIYGAVEEHTTVAMKWYGWMFPLISMLILEYSYRLLMKIAKQEESPALAADAMHYRIDSLTSLFAVITLAVAAYLPTWSLQVDHLGAIAIAVFMIINGLLASRANFHQLMDRAPEPEFFQLTRLAALKTEGVQEVEKIKIQRYGPDAHIVIDVEVMPELSVEEAHKISQRVRLEIQKAWPSVLDVSVHIEPYYINDH